MGRTCATHVGGAEGLIARRTEPRRRMERLDDPVQRDGRGRALAEVAAVHEAVEGDCTRILTRYERSLGMAAHDARGLVDRLRRDLSLFLRRPHPTPSSTALSPPPSGSGSETSSTPIPRPIAAPT